MQSSREDATCRLGSLADLLGVQVHDAVTGRPGPAEQHGGMREYNRRTASRDGQSCRRSYSQSGLVGGGVVGQPTTVSQTLHHLEAGDRRQSV